MRLGKLRAIPSRIPIRNPIIESTMDGVYSTKALSKPSTRLSITSAIAGTHSPNITTSISITDLKASPIAEALLAIAIQSAAIPSPIFVMMVGMSSAMPVKIMVKEATIAVAPAVPAAARAVRATAKADNPALTRVKPAPMPSMDTPIRANATHRLRIVGTSGASTKPATPITAKAPARATRPLAMDSQLIAPKTLSAVVMISKAEAATSIAAEPKRVPFIAFKPTERITIDPPRAISPLAISSQDIEPKSPTADASTLMATANIMIPAAIGIEFTPNFALFIN